MALRRSSRRKPKAKVSNAPEAGSSTTPTTATTSTEAPTSVSAPSTPAKKTVKKFSPRLTRSARKKKLEEEEKRLKEEKESLEKLKEEVESSEDSEDSEEEASKEKEELGSESESSDEEDEEEEEEEEEEEQASNEKIEPQKVLKNNINTKQSLTNKKVEDEDGEDVDESDNSDDSRSDEENEVEEEEEVEEQNHNKVFSDENAEWLKPKVKKDLLTSDNESDEDDDIDMEIQNDEYDAEEDGNDDENEKNDDESVSSSSTASSLLSIERQSKLLDRQIAREKAEGEAEYQQIIATQTSIYQLPTAEEIESEMDGTRVMNPADLRERIQSVLEVLSNFKASKMPNKSRSDYMERLSSDMAELFGYLPELVEYFLSMLGPHETLQFLEASDTARPVVLRTNTLKARRKDLAQSLIKRGVNLDPLSDWSKVGLKIYESPVPLGATPEYLAGHYMLQSAASMCPVLALSPNVNQRVLDMSAAPGGKTSYIAQLMKNTGMILANDLKPERQKATIANMHRLGVRNTVVCCHDGRKLGKLYPKSFDRILLDAPCSGLGVISRDPSVKVQRTIADVLRTSHLQKELLLSAVDALNVKKDGGIMVYSTCSVSIAENEEVVDYLLRKRDVKLIDTGLDFGKPGFTRYQQKRFHPSLVNTRRFYPHVHNMDGFYVCKIQKISHGVKKEESITPTGPITTEEIKAHENVVSNDEEEHEDIKNSKKTQIDKSKKMPKSKTNPKKIIDEKKVKKHPKFMRNKNGQKKRKRSEEEMKAMNRALKKGKQNVSIPPSFEQKHSNDTKKKKKSTNAKVTKPRRKKI